MTTITTMATSATVGTMVITRDIIMGTITAIVTTGRRTDGRGLPLASL